MKVTHVDGSVTEWRIKDGALVVRANAGAWHVARPKSIARGLVTIREAGSATEALAALDASAFDAVDLTNGGTMSADAEEAKYEVTIKDAGGSVSATFIVFRHEPGLCSWSPLSVGLDTMAAAPGADLDALYHAVADLAEDLKLFAEPTPRKP